MQAGICSRRTKAAPAARSPQPIEAAACVDAWVIAGGSWRYPVYWSGAGWSGNAAHAVLLVRRADAVRVALNFELMGPDWDVPADVRPVPATKVSPAAMVRSLARWKVTHGHDQHDA